LFDADLDVFPLHVDTATTIEVFTDVGGSGDNFTGTILDEDVSNVIGSPGNNTAPFTGTYNPEGDFNLFDGQDSAGTWRLSIDDDAAGNTGTLLNWTLQFTIAVDLDCNTNGTIDGCEGDCNTNGSPDPVDICNGNSADANGDGVPDECSLCLTCPGDVSGDGLVDGDDVVGFVECAVSAMSCACTDLDGDGVTAEQDTSDDLAMFVDKLLNDTDTICP